MWNIPTLVVKGRHKYEIPTLVEIIEKIMGMGTVVACLEPAVVMPGEGAVGAATFGRGVGILEGILAAKRIPYTVVPAQRWKKVLLADLPRDKNSSRLRAGQLFPECASILKTISSHNRADALLIAEYCRRTLL